MKSDFDEMDAEPTDEAEVSFEDRVRVHSVNFLSEATGGDSGFLERMSYSESAPTMDELVRALKEAKVPMSKILREDLVRVFDGEEPRYFISPHRAVELYRLNHGIHLPPRRPSRIRNGMEVALDYARKAHRAATEFETYGASLEEFRRGIACPTEQSFFYASQEWIDRAKVIRVIDRFTCRECTRRIDELGSEERLHAHHDEHIYSAYSDAFYRNFDSNRIRALCSFCHDRFHESHKRGATHFVNATEIELQEQKKLRADMSALHDELRECHFCFKRYNSLPFEN